MLEPAFTKGQNYVQTNDWRGLQNISTMCVILNYIWGDNFNY